MFVRVLSAVAVLAAFAVTAEGQAAPSTVTFTGGRGNISNTVAIPANAAVVWTSGTVPSVADTSAAAESPARSTVGVHSLVNAAWLVEVEAFAVYPPK
jgi:enamine deaminase RidA (YjgF/YER057c/UK114 family)